MPTNRPHFKPRHLLWPPFALLLLVIICTLGLWLSGCQGRKVLHEQEVQRDSTHHERIRERIIIRTLAQTDTVFRIRELPVGKPILIQDPQLRSQLQLLRQQNDQLNATCVALPDTLVVRDTIKRTVIRYQEREKQVRQKNRWGWGETFTLLTLGLIIVAVVLRLWIRR